MKTLGLLVCLGAAALCGCANQAALVQAQNNFNVGMADVGAANAALITLNKSLIGNLAAQAKAFGPYLCGAINLGAEIASDPTVASKVSAFLTQHSRTATNLIVVSDVCKVAGLATNISSVAASP